MGNLEELKKAMNQIKLYSECVTDGRWCCASLQGFYPLYVFFLKSQRLQKIMEKVFTSVNKTSRWQ